MNHPATIGPYLDTPHRHTGQPKQHRRTLLQGPCLQILLR